MAGPRPLAAFTLGLCALTLSCGDATRSSAVDLPQPIDAAELPIAPRVRIDQAVGLSEDEASEWARQSGWSKIEVVSDEFLELSSSPRERLLLTVEDGVVVEAWAG